MSALLENLPRYRVMTVNDLDAVMAIEKVVYPHPWTRGNFSDSLHSGYDCWIMECGGEIIGYSVVMIAAGEVHLLNLSIAARWQRRGHGRRQLEYLIDLARDVHADKILLEVRISNVVGRGLYADAGFSEIATRRGYYPDDNGREDAIVMELELR
jgi:ribosomal-protein-alanine N-acetyltransferase